MGSIRKLQNGSYEARYRDPAGRSRSKTKSTKAEARLFLASVETDKSRGMWTDPRHTRIRFGPWATERLEARLGLRPATEARDLSLLNNHLLPAFCDMRLGDINRAMVTKWIAREAQTYQPATVRECYRILSSLMKDAVEDRLIPESPCRRVALPRKERVEKRFLTPDEVERLVFVFAAHYRALIHTAVYLGCRWEELAGLKRKHLNLLRGQVKIIGTIERVAGTYRYVEDTKSDASRATLKLPRFLIGIIAEHLRHPPESEYVFPARGGGHLRYDNFRVRVWNPAVERAGLAPLTFHELRHTAAAIMIDQGADPLVVQRRMRHRDIKTTYNEYGHLFPNREDELNEALERVYEQAHVGFSWDSVAELRR